MMDCYGKNESRWNPLLMEAPALSVVFGVTQVLELTSRRSQVRVLYCPPVNIRVAHILVRPFGQTQCSSLTGRLPADLKISPAAVIYPDSATIKTPTAALPA
jgi:hypothetical protein